MLFGPAAGEKGGQSSTISRVPAIGRCPAKGRGYRYMRPRCRDSPDLRARRQGGTICRPEFAHCDPCARQSSFKVEGHRSALDGGGRGWGPPESRPCPNRRRRKSGSRRARLRRGVPGPQPRQVRPGSFLARAIAAIAPHGSARWDAPQGPRHWPRAPRAIGLLACPADYRESEAAQPTPPASDRSVFQVRGCGLARHLLSGTAFRKAH